MLDSLNEAAKQFIASVHQAQEAGMSVVGRVTVLTLQNVACSRRN